VIACQRRRCRGTILGGSHFSRSRHSIVNPSQTEQKRETGNEVDKMVLAWFRFSGVYNIVAGHESTMTYRKIDFKTYVVSSGLIIQMQGLTSRAA